MATASEARRGRCWRRSLLLPLLLGGCLTDPELKTPGDSAPVETGDGWMVSTPEAERIDPAGLNEAAGLFFSEDHYFNAVSLLVARNGRLVLEAYARGPADRTVVRSVQSTTKSVTSLVFGIARDDGYFPDLDQPLYDILPDKFDGDPAKRRVTLRHLLTMRSGIAFYNDDFSVEMLVDRPADQARYILAKPMFAAPGDSFYYRDADPQLLSGAFRRVTARTLESVAVERLFAPLGIRDWYWEADVEGTTMGPYGLALAPRDLAKIGQLVLQRGRWQGRQLISESWLQQSTSPQTASNYAEWPYGFYWWVVPEIEGVTTWGHGGNYALIVPRLDLLVVMTSLPHTNDDVVGTRLEDFLVLVRLIVGATRE